MVTVFAQADTPRPKTVSDILAEDAIRVVVSSCKPGETAALREAITNWFELAPYATIQNLEKYRAELLTLLYRQNNPVSIAFADAFVPESTQSAPRPHPETPAELMLSAVFGMPKSAKWNEIQDASREDQRDTLPGQAADKTYRLRKLLGLSEIPILELYKSIPRDRETVMPWLLSFAREARMSLSDIANIEAVLRDLDEGAEGRIPTSPISQPQVGVLNVEPALQTRQPGSSESLADSRLRWIIVVLFGAGLGLLCLLRKWCSRT